MSFMTFIMLEIWRRNIQWQERASQVRRMRILLLDVLFVMGKIKSHSFRQYD